MANPADPDRAWLFQAFFASSSVECARDALQRHASEHDDPASELFTQIDRILKHDSTDAVGAALRDFRGRAPDMYALLLFSYLRWSGDPRLQDLRALERWLDGELDLGVVLLRSAIGYSLALAGRGTEAVPLLQGCMKASEVAGGSPILRQFVQCLTLRNLGLVFRRLGHFEQAAHYLEEGLSRSTAAGFSLELSLTLQVANLYWASGQYQEALRVSANPDSRARAEAIADTHFLVRSHLNACKCAIDLKQTQLAWKELAAARPFLARERERFAIQSAYAQLYEGELHVQEGRFDAGLGLIQQAQTSFEACDPPHYPGALDAKIAQVHFCLYEGDHRSALIFIRKLLDEAQERSCMEARSRLLLLETYILLADDDALRGGFEDLVSRVHLINNPALLLCALGNLFTHALAYLGSTEQRFLLDRIRNLRPVLEASCYDDLYRRYVTERYAFAMEKRLERERGIDIQDLLDDSNE